MAAVTLNYLEGTLRLAALGLFVAASVVYVQDQRDEHFVMRGQSNAERIVANLTRVVPNPPAHGALILFWSPPGYNYGFQAIEGHYGPQFLYQDYELQVFDGSALRCDDGFWVAPEGWYLKVGQIDPGRAIPVLLSDTGAVRLTRDEAFPPSGCDPG
jgi:hypothetical protein